MGTVGGSVMTADPFLVLIEQVQGDAHTAKPVDAVDTSGQDALPLDLPSSQAAEGKKPRKKAEPGVKKMRAREVRLRAAEPLLYGPDFTIAEFFGCAPDEVGFTPSQYRSSRKPVVSKLPMSVLESAYLADARRLTDYLADRRVGVENAKTRNPSNSSLESADHVLRTLGYSYAEAVTVVDFLESRNGLATWVIDPNQLRRHIDEIVHSAAFAPWLTRTNRSISTESLERAAARRATAGTGSPTGAGVGKSGLQATPRDVRDAEWANNGRRTIQL